MTPFLSAIELDFWIVFPSAMGSLKGIPISIAEHNFSSSNFKIISLLILTSGYPEVKKGIIPIPL